MDAVAECEQHTKQMGMRESSSQWRLYFRKEFFTPWNDPKSDTMATDLIYQQVMRGITVGEYKCEKEEVLDLLAAQRYYCEYPGNTDTAKIKSFLTHWLPEEHKKAKTIDTWVQEVTQKLQNDIIKEKPEIESLKRDIVIFSKNKWFNIFSRFYDASKVYTPTGSYHDSILGLNSRGLYIMDEQEDIKSQVLFIEIVSVSRSRHSVTVQTVSGEECSVHSTHSEDLYTLLSTFLDGLRLQSKYALVIQDSTQIEGAIGVSVTKGDLVILDQPYEVYVQEDVISGTCKRTGKLHTMPRDLLYVLPAIEEPPPEIMGMLSVQLRKDTSHFPTVPLYQEEHSLQNYAKVNFRSTSDNTINKLLSKASFKRSAKDKSLAAWQFQKDAIKKPLLRRTLIKEEIRGTSCRSFLQYMGDAPIKDSMSEMDIANELIIEPAMRSRHMRDEVYCQVVKQITNNPDRSSEEKGWQLLYLLSSCAVPSSDLYDECEQFMKMNRHGMAQRCLEQFRRRKREGARLYPPHTKEHENFSSKSKTIKISIAFPFQKQQHEFEMDPSSRVMDLKKQLVDQYGLESTEEYGLCFGLKDRVISANDEEYFLDALSSVERFWMRPIPISNGTDPRPGPSQPLVTVVHVFYSLIGFFVCLYQPQTRSLTTSSQCCSCFLQHNWILCLSVCLTGTDPRPGPSQPLVSVVHVFFLKKLWVNVEPGKNNNADTMFHFPQEVPNYLRGYHSCSDKDAGKLGALIYHSNFGDDLSAMEFFGDNITALIPTPLIEKKAITEWKKMVEQNLESTKGLKSNDAKLAFLRILSQWPTFGSVFFQVKQRSLKSFPKHILFAVNSEGIMFLDLNTKNVLAKYPYNKIPNWAFDEQSFTLVIGEGSSANKLYLETNLGHNIDDIIMSYVALMMNMHIKRKPNYSGVTVGESIC
ncbi:hypothetical protein FSP39_020064 [Pinctada imbricata]|uniref:FERM domain-containing protein n=1 Tax=Pinctada imbricata TaxID=66713 RepID=A0AA88Y055_PINIB|nr:hypothetical protein FSP39_020064 [Pinctada imbricata]